MTALETNHDALVMACKQAMSGPIAVLYGGWSSERDVSLMSGEAILAALQPTGLDVQGIDIGRDVADQLKQRGIRHVFNALHGPYGEDGVIGGLLQLLGITATGSGVLASALAMDKLRSKQLWDGIGVSTPRFELVTEPTDWNALLERLGGKAMIKPSREGSSIGMAIASAAKEMGEAVTEAWRYDPCVLAEQFIEGPEFSVPIIGSEVLPVVELRPAGQFYDYNAKYVASDTEYQCPARLAAKPLQQAVELAQLAYTSLGCEGWGRVDLMQDKSGNFYVLEVNTIPGMTSHSIVPMSAAACDLDFTALVLNVLLDSLNSDVAGQHA